MLPADDDDEVVARGHAPSQQRIVYVALNEAEFGRALIDGGCNPPRVPNRQA